MNQVTYNLKTLVDLVGNYKVIGFSKSTIAIHSEESNAAPWTREPDLVNSTFSYRLNSNSIMKSTYEITSRDDINNIRISNPTTYEELVPVDFLGTTCNISIVITNRDSGPNLKVEHYNKNNELQATYTSNKHWMQVFLTVENGDYIVITDLSECFPAGTPILMWDGSFKNIENISVGEYIAGYDMTKQWEAKAQVTSIVTGYTDRITTLTTADYTTITMAEGHPVYTQEGLKSTTGKDNLPILKTGDTVKTVYGWSSITSLSTTDVENTKVYSLELDNPNYTYYAGKISVGGHSGGSLD